MCECVKTFRSEGRILLHNKDSDSTADFAKPHKPCGRKCCPHHISRTSSALEPIARVVGASPPVRRTSFAHGAKDDRPVAFPNRLRICRLMYKPLPHGSCKLDPRHYRNRRLALIKKRAIKVTQACAARRAIPHYFQKRIKHRLLVKKSASQQEERDPTDCERSTANGTQVSDNSPTTAEAPPHIDADSVESTAGTVPPTKTTVLERTDALNTFKEYYSIQSAIRLLLSMLQERMEEVETMQKKRILPDPKDEAMETAATVLANADAVEPTENDSKESLVKIEPTNRTPEHGTTVKNFDPDKENNVPLASALESLSPVTVALNRVNSTPAKEDSKEDARPTYSFLETSKSDILDPSYTCDIELEPLEDRKNRSIVDSLLNKFNLSPPVKATVPVAFADGAMDGADGRRSLRDRTKIAARARYSEIPEEPRKARVSKVFGKLHKTLNIEFDCTNSNSSTEFYGFDDGEMVKLDKPSLPGLLPTPIVKKPQPFAPFLTYGSCMEAQQAKSENETEKRSDLFREEGLISFGSVPPRLECPQRPTDMVRPRTVAQKRILVQRENDIRYVMIDNESKIFQFLKKRSRNIDAALDFCRMKELQDQQIPFTRSTWRALAWLRSEKGRYFFQKMTIDNRTIKLSGCRGNHRLQYVTRNTLYSSPVIASRGHRYHYVSNCRCPEYPEGVTINVSQDSAVARRNCESRALPADNSKYLFHGSSNNADYQSKRSYPGTKPGPLSSKCLQPSPDEDPCLGPLEIFKMPKVELEVFPKLNRPLDGFVKPYLKMILPHDDITENWARFAVSTLTAPRAEAEEQDSKPAADHEERSFVFELPYQNDQRRILIRRRVLACPGAPMNVDVVRFTKLMDEKLTFRKAIDEALARGERDQIDADELVCADVLSALTDSVAISLAEDVFVRDDESDTENGKKKGGDIRALPNEPKIVPLKVDTSELAAAAVKTTTTTTTTPTPSPSLAAPNDADGDAASLNGAGSECSKTTDPAKLKLLREMKRLNATIIEGPSEPAPSPTEPGRQQRCDLQYCAKGCICDVLSSTQAVSVANIHRKQHCGQIDCVFGCICGFAENSTRTVPAKVDHAEEDEGETALSIEEQRYLREKATARLAKEEREFTPTVILTKNTTVLVQNKESECRRLKKKPKKYDDYYNDQSVQCLLNGGSVKDVSAYISKPPPNAKPLTELERMRHAHVLLTKLTQLEDIEPLCMVHDLYRCFCNGKATHGKPFSFTEENCIPIPPKTSAAAVVTAATSVVPDAAGGRTMTKGDGGQTSTKKRTKDQEVVEYGIVDPASSSLANARKRLYYFEKPHSECSDSVEERSGRASQVAGQRRRRDSSEESYKPPNERKVAKKNPKPAATNHDNATPDPFSGAIRARRASVAPGHVFARGESTLRKPSTQPTALPSKRLSLINARRSSVASAQLPLQKKDAGKPVKSTHATASRSEELERSTVDNSHYTIIKPTIASGSSKINSLILKRVPSQATDSETPAATQSAPVPGKSSAVCRQMSVRELKQLMLRECKSAVDETERSLPADSEQKPPVVKIALVDSEENIDNEPRFNILSEGTKKLVISGKRRSFVENTEFRNGYPPARTIQSRSRTVYVVEMATDASTVDGPPKAVEPPAKKASNQTPPELPSGSTFGADASRNHPVQNGDGPTEKTDRLLSSLMSHINEMLRRNSLDISPGKKGILHICRWKQLLSSFALGEIDVLDLTLTNGTEMTVITRTPSVPQLLPNVQCQISANRLTIDKLSAAERPSLLMKMIVAQVDNVKMNNLALVLYGNKNFWHFCGFLKVSEKCFKTDSNVLSTPSTEANAKIKARLREYYQKTFPRTNASQTTVAKVGTATEPQQQQQQQQQQQSSSKPGGGPATISLSTQSNIEILRKGGQQVHYPLGLLPGLAGSSNGGSADCRWMRLKIENDFSHMYIQSWQCCLTYGTIKKAIYDANRTKKSVCLETPIPREQLKTQMLPYVYALPKEGHSLFLGPYPCSESKVDVILCQSVNGSLYEREVYERLHDIPMNGSAKRTTGTWVDAVTSRVASVDILPKRSQMGAETKNACAPVPVGSTNQRSLLKRNNIVSVSRAGAGSVTAAVAEPDQSRKVVLSPCDSDNDDDDVVVLETNQEDDSGATIRSVNVGAVQPLRKELTGGCSAVDLLKLVQGTMKQNQQSKREIALGLEQHRSSSSKAHQTPTAAAAREANANRKRIAPEPLTESFTAPKVPRRSDPSFEGPITSNLGARAAPPSGTVPSIGFRRLSLSGAPQLMAAPTVIRNSGGGTVTITPFKQNERPISVRISQSSDRPAPQTARNVPEPVERRSLGTMKVPPLVPRARLNSVAVERFNRSSPPLLPVAADDDVVLVDDDDEMEMVNKASSSSASNLPRVTAAPASIAGSKGDTTGTPPAGVQKKFLSREEFDKISHKVDLSKTGQQNGYNYDRATGVLKINRSLLNSLQRDGVMLPQSVGGSNTPAPKPGSGVATNGTNATVPSSVRPVGVAAASPSTTKTMPRMKVVPRVTATPCGDEQNSSDSGAADTSVAPPRTNGKTANPAINLKYLNEAQKDRRMLMQPHTKGVLESKIPGLGLVEAVRFSQEVIINLKELTVSKQLVSVANLEAAVTLLNQFIQRNTYTFKPQNLVIQWQFKERTVPLTTAEKLTSLISQCCVVTPYGLMNLFKQEQIETVKTTVPTLYEDMLMMKLSMLCFDKKRYEEEKCYEHEDKIYDRARETISTVERKEKQLRRQIFSMEQTVKRNEAKLKKLKQETGTLSKEASSSVPAPASSSRGESVIVIDDD
ncbi:uncharacterized protein LOC118503447 isoform X2 [Anopheles stephensi]|uniref:uncharacterized protein LOC118503447 isoform X2 n=1 Tax=Anopheles stephensi TaxID=30069 RepID=UPI001658A375|nr:uncharacterized protein LOC118503447 isoform X2 [Anopheles stephensi]